MYSVSDETRKPIFEGVQGENEAREIQFDVTAWVEELGEGVCTATAKRPTDTTPYPVTVTRSGNVVTWKPNSADTSIEGIGAFQLAFSINDVVAKTRIWNTKIAPSLVGAGDPPDPYDNWLAEMRSIEAGAIQAAQDADASADAADASVEEINDAYFMRMSTTWRRGVPGADGSLYPNNGATTAIVTGAEKVSFSSTCKAVALLYADGVYLGKLNTSGGIDKQGGNWRYLTGEVNIKAILNEFNANGVIFGVIPTDSATITNDAEAETYGEEHCEIYSISFYDRNYIDEALNKKQDKQSRNLIGMLDGVLYPVDGLEVGTELTMSTSDGENTGLGTDGSGSLVQLYFYDENKQYITYWSMFADAPRRTITLGASIGAGAKYLTWKHKPRTAMMLEFGSMATEYEPYFVSLPELTEKVQEIENGTQDITEIHKQAKEETAVIKKHFGTSNPVDNSFKILWFSDVHGETDRMQRAVELINNWGGEYFDAAINTGDTVPLVFGDNIEWYDDAVSGSSVPVLNTVGNHDAWLSLNGNLAPKTDVYTKFIAPVASSASIVQPSGASANGLNYYYKDIGGVRVIVLDCMYWDSAQLSWFSSALADAKTNGLPVIACSHAPFDVAGCTLADSVWNVGWFHRDGTTTNIAAAQAVKTFMDGGGVFICWLQGHIHGDEIDLLPNYGEQIALCTNSFQNRGTTVVKTDNASAYNYDSLTYITVDTANKYVKMFRIGANIDTAGHKRNGFVWDYENKRIVTEW